jgi:hypothetical protein
LDWGDPLPEAAGYGEKLPRVTDGWDAPAKASRGVRAERRRHQEAPRFEVEGRIHGCVRILAATRVPSASPYGRMGA